MTRIIILLFILFIPLRVNASTFFVRSDGGSGTQCTGLADAAYDGSGSGEACAYNHLNWVVPMYGQPTTYKMAGGDIVVIKSGTYRMGCQAGGTCRDAAYNVTVSGTCDSTFSYDCKGSAPPDGTAGAYTTIIGCSTTGCGCVKDHDTVTCAQTPPVLWSAGRSNQLISLEGSDYVKLQDLELTDHAAGTYSKEAACNSGASSLAGLNGISSNSGSNIIIQGLNIHGFCQYGMRLGGIDTFSLIDSTINANGWAGWSLDSCAGAGNCGMTGDITITNNTITYSGCAEDYPSIGLLANGCRAQADGIIADGIESAAGAGNWVVTNNNISWNTHDGSDLLYINLSSYDNGTVVYRRNRFEGNAGNPVKGPNALIMEDNLILGNCGYFTGQAFTSATWSDTSDSCRAQGNAVEIAFRDNTTTPIIINNTILSNGDVGIATNGTCTTGTDVIVTNNIMLGGRQHSDDTAFNGAGGNDTSSVYFDSDSGTCNADFVETYNICYGWKEGSSACNGTGSTDTVYPSLVGGTINMGPDSSPGYYSATTLAADVHLTASNGAANTSASGADNTDYYNYLRGVSWDVGAIEYGSLATCLNGAQDGDETGVDCGGSCGACSGGGGGTTSSPSSGIRGYSIMRGKSIYR